MRRDEEENLAALTSRELALEQVAHNWNGSETGVRC